MRRAARRVAPIPVIPIARPPAEARYAIGGHPYRVRVWLAEQWDRLDESARPRDAQPLPGLGWVHVEPLGDPG
jgi:hypothetical protein